MAIKINADEYKNITNLFKDIHQPIYIPTMDEIDILEKDIKKNYLFILYVLEKASLLNSREYNLKLKEIERLKAIKDKNIKLIPIVEDNLNEE